MPARTKVAPAREPGQARHNAGKDHSDDTAGLEGCQVAPLAVCQPLPLAIEVRANAEPPGAQFVTLLESNRRFKGAWKRTLRGTDEYGTREWDTELAMHVCASPKPWTDQALCDLLVASHKKHGDALGDISYYRDIIRHARATCAALQQSTESMRDIEAGVGIETPQAKLAKLREVLRLPLARVVKQARRHEHPEFHFVFDSGERIVIGGAKDMLSRRHMRGIVAANAHLVVPLLKQSQWDKLAELMLAICEVEQLPEDCTEHGEVRIALTEYLQRATLLRQGPDGEHPFVRDGAVYFVGSHFREWWGMQRLGDLSGKRFGRTMGLLGVRSEVVYMELKKQGATTRNCWRLPPGLVPEVEP